MTIATIVVAVIFVSAVLLFLAQQPGTKNKGLESFPDFVRTLIATKENGSELKVWHRGSDKGFSFIRVSGDDTQAQVELAVPRAVWSELYAAKISDAFSSHGFEFVGCAESTQILGKVVLYVPDIWDRASGSSCAHAARILAESIDLPRTARFDVRFVGPTSKRVLNAGKQGKF